MSNLHSAKFAVLLGAAFLSAKAQASSADGGKPINLITNNAGRLFFEYDGTRTDRPACSVLNRWVIDATTDQGRAMMALLLTAKAQGKRIAIRGTHDCRDWGDTESVDFFVVHE